MNIWHILLIGISFVPSRYCPRACSCLYEMGLHPSILIDCTNLGLDRFPLNSSLLESDFCRYTGAGIEIDLSRNKITQVNIPSSVKGLSRIDLSYNEITHVKNIVIKGAEVKALDLSHNKRLEKVTTDLKSESLEILTASRCSINEIEEGFLESIPLLKSLDISCNALRELNRFVSSEAANLEKSSENRDGYFQLNFLNVSHNSLQGIRGKDFARMKMKILDVSTNKITHFEFTAYFRYLEELYASDNDIRTFDGMLLPNVRVLDASRNKLRDVYIDLTEKAPKLEILNLSHNSLGNIPEIKSFSVSDLDVSHCRIRYIEAGTFSALEQLKRLDLNGNELTVLREEVLVNFRNLEFLNLETNPWKCDCESAEFKTLYNFVLSDRAYSDGKDLLCENNALRTWNDACKDDWNSNDDITQSKKASFNALIYICIALLLTIALISCYKFIMDARRSNAMLLENGPDFVNETEEEISSQIARQEEMRDASVETIPCSYSTRRSTPPPNYEAALLLPALTEEEREMAVSNLSLNRVIQ